MVRNRVRTCRRTSEGSTASCRLTDCAEAAAVRLGRRWRGPLPGHHALMYLPNAARASKASPAASF